MCIRIDGFYSAAKRYLVRQNLWFACGLVVTLCLFFVLNLSMAVSMATGATPQPWADRPPTVDPTFGLPIPSAVDHPAFLPAWIWAAQTHNNQTIYLRHSFKLATVPHVVQLYAAAEDHLEIFLNGKKITTTFHRGNKLWRRACDLSVTKWLHRGDNTIAIRAQNANGKAGVILWMIAGSKTLCLTNGQWHVAIRPPGEIAWTRATVKCCGLS